MKMSVQIVSFTMTSRGIELTRKHCGRVGLGSRERETKMAEKRVIE